MGDAIICFSFSLLYWSMMRAHLLPLVLGRVGKQSAQSFATEIHAPGKRQLNPRGSLGCVSFPFLLKESLFLIALKSSSFCDLYCSGFTFVLWQPWCLLAVALGWGMSGNKPQPYVPVRLANTIRAVSVSLLFTCASRVYLMPHYRPKCRGKSGGVCWHIWQSVWFAFFPGLLRTLEISGRKS